MTTPEREAKNAVAMRGHIQDTFRALGQTDEPDAVHCYLVELAHIAVDIGFEFARASLKPSPSPVVRDLGVHQVSAPVEISSCATCGHPVESGGERPAAADEAWAHCMQMALTDLANIAYQDGRDEKSPWSLQWQKLADRVSALAAYCPASDNQESGSTECKEARLYPLQAKELIMNEVTPIQPPGAADGGRE